MYVYLFKDSPTDIVVQYDVYCQTSTVLLLHSFRSKLVPGSCQYVVHIILVELKLMCY